MTDEKLDAILRNQALIAGMIQTSILIYLADSWETKHRNLNKLEQHSQLIFNAVKALTGVPGNGTTKPSSGTPQEG